MTAPKVLTSDDLLSVWMLGFGGGVSSAAKTITNAPDARCDALADQMRKGIEDDPLAREDVKTGIAGLLAGDELEVTAWQRKAPE